jgi:hemoglobin-like flavoprotein
MNANQIALVKESWSYVIVKSDEAGQLFYSRLFEVAPGVQHLFKGDPKEQSRKLMSMITVIVSKLDNLETILDDIRSLASRHNKYGAKKEHYAVVGACLIWTLKTGLGDRWTKSMEEAWGCVYQVLSDAMIVNQESTAPKFATTL